MRTLGVDLSANPAKTGACAIDWDAGTVMFLDRPTHDDVPVEATAASDMTAIDVPLGWPDGFVEAILAHRNGVGWRRQPLLRPLTAFPCATGRRTFSFGRQGPSH